MTSWSANLQAWALKYTRHGELDVCADLNKLRSAENGCDVRTFNNQVHISVNGV